MNLNNKVCTVLLKYLSKTFALFNSLFFFQNDKINCDTSLLHGGLFQNIEDSLEDGCLFLDYQISIRKCNVCTRNLYSKFSFIK